MANCDAIVFASYSHEDNLHTVMTFLQTKKGKKIQPTEMGHRYNILIFDRASPTEKDIEMFTAILGDPKGYVERIGKSGYHGLVVKQKACKTKELKETFSKVLYQFGFEEKLIKRVMKTTVV